MGEIGSSLRYWSKPIGMTLHTHLNNMVFDYYEMVCLETDMNDGQTLREHFILKDNTLLNQNLFLTIGIKVF